MSHEPECIDYPMTQTTGDCDCERLSAAYQRGRADEREKVAEAIFNEEQLLCRQMVNDPTNPHYSGILRGLQRSRDIVAARGEGAE